ncbi:DUF645 family protein [Vibrio cholerae]|nr:DUF645 family protein [Vibrio cholerae]
MSQLLALDVCLRDAFP